MSAEYLKVLCLPLMLVVLMAVGCPMPADEPVADVTGMSSVSTDVPDTTQQSTPDIAELIAQIQHDFPNAPAINLPSGNPGTDPTVTPPATNNPPSTPPANDNPPTPPADNTTPTPPVDNTTPTPPANTTFTLASSAFANGSPIPQQYAGAFGVSPPLSWTGVPANTQQFALIVDDPDAGSPAFVHWVIYNITSTTTSLPENVFPYDGFASNWRQGFNDFGSSGYGGPNPPSGPAHHYHFTLYALDTAFDLQSGLSKDEVLSAINGHVLAQTELVGTFAQ